MNHDDVTTPWRKPSYSNSQANCVEVARTGSGKVAVRDSKDPGGGALRFSPDEWQAFAVRVRTMASHSLGAWAVAPRGGSLRCRHGMTTAAERPKQAMTARKNH